MPSQYDYLVDNEMRGGLRRREPSAECALARRYNRGRRPEGRLVVPAPGSDYSYYDTRLLALLWAVGRNALALHLLARQYGWVGAEAPDYPQMSDELALFLWMWGGDGLALEMLWMRRGWLPVGEVDRDTPDAVLGFLWWRYRRPEARDELFRRYHSAADNDAAQDRAVTLLLVVDRWDYEHYSTLDSLMNVSTARRQIDAGRREGRAPRVDQDEVENAAAMDWARPETVVLERDFLETNVPLELRCLHKIKENSEEQPLDLTAEELDYLARKNLAYAGAEETSGPSLARERKRIIAWMAQHGEPSEEQIRAGFPWFRQSGLARQTRLWRLQWRADQNNRLLTPLLTGGEETLIDLACTVQDNMDELTRRIETAGRSETPAERGPVLLYSELADASQRFRDMLEERRLHNGRAANIGAWQTNLQAFLEAFPILRKLAACRRLVSWLLHVGFPAHEVPGMGRLSDWLEGGQWLATFGREDRERSDFFRRWLTARRPRFQDDSLAGIDLLILWLQSTQEPGQPGRTLLDADRAWWLGRSRPSALRPVQLAPAESE
jgi:hypothetical protein